MTKIIMESGKMYELRLNNTEEIMIFVMFDKTVML